MCTVNVPSVDAYFARAQKLGGSVALPKMAIPGVGSLVCISRIRRRGDERRGASCGSDRCLILDFVAWVAEEPPPYDEVMAAWRTSCPRLTVWEDAVEAGYVGRVQGASVGQIVHVTPRGVAFLAAHERQSPSR